MLEGVLKERLFAELFGKAGSFNPWYVGGGVKRHIRLATCRETVKLNAL